MSGKISAFSRPTICRSRHHVGEQSESNACMKPSGISSSFVGRWYVRERSRRFTMESRSESCHEVQRVAEIEVEAHAGVPNAGKSGRQRSRGTSSRYAYKDVSMPEEGIGMELKVYQPSIIHHQHIYFHCVTRNPPQTLRSWISRRQRPTTPEDCGGGTSEKVSSSQSEIKKNSDPASDWLACP